MLELRCYFLSTTTAHDILPWVIQVIYRRRIPASLAPPWFLQLSCHRTAVVVAWILCAKQIAGEWMVWMVRRGWWVLQERVFHFWQTGWMLWWLSWVWYVAAVVASFQFDFASKKTGGMPATPAFLVFWGCSCTVKIIENKPPKLLELFTGYGSKSG